MIRLLKIFSLNFICWLWIPVGFSAPAGTVVMLRGKVQILDKKGRVLLDSTSKDKANRLDSGSELNVGDQIVTAMDGRLKLKFFEGANEMVIGTNTRITIERASDGRDDSKKGTTLDLRKGRVRSTVNTKYSGEGSNVYQVKTPNGVAGVRGTVFVTNFDPRIMATDVITERGKVMFEAVNEQRQVVKDSGRLVEAGAFSSLIGGGEGVKPMEPRPIEQMKGYEKLKDDFAKQVEKKMEEAGFASNSEGEGDGTKRGPASINEMKPMGNIDANMVEKPEIKEGQLALDVQQQQTQMREMASLEMQRDMQIRQEEQAKFMTLVNNLPEFIKNFCNDNPMFCRDQGTKIEYGAINFVGNPIVAGTPDAATKAGVDSSLAKCTTQIEAQPTCIKTHQTAVGEPILEDPISCSSTYVTKVVCTHQ